MPVNLHTDISTPELPTLPLIMPRRKTREVQLHTIKFGGDNPVVVQSMTNTDTRNVEATVQQINDLAAVGCEVVRIAVPDEAAAKALREIRKQTTMPLIADIHFDHFLAILALEAGVDGLRINPGNIGGEKNIKRLVHAAKAHGALIRIGVNAGSLEKELLAQFGSATPEAMVASALRHIQMLEKHGFEQIKVSLKSSSVLHTIASYRLLAEQCEYPFHIGVTEAGTPRAGAVKSAVGLGTLLWLGIGDTLRVSLTADPVQEVPVAWDILKSLGLRSRGIELISCPTCGRTEIELIELAQAVEKALATVTVPLKIAVMGCVVNGPGEAREANIGIAGGRDKGVIFCKGEIIRTVKGNANLLPAFLEEVAKVLNQKNNT